MNRTPAVALGVGLALIVVGLLVRPHPHRWVVDAAWATKQPHGPVRFCSGPDVTKTQQRGVNDYNKDFPNAPATFVGTYSRVADHQYKQYVDEIKSRDQNCDVIYLDVTYMKALASQHLLYDMTPYLKPREKEFNGQTISSVTFGSQSWGVPKQLDVGAIYYDSRRVSPPPRTWNELARQARPLTARAHPGLRLPFGGYEGLTVVFLDLAFAAGAQPIVSADGTQAHIDQPPVLAALRFLHDAHKNRVIPDVKDQTEDGNLLTFEIGRAKFLRAWPYAFVSIRADAAHPKPRTTLKTRQTRAAIADHLKVMALPPWKRNGHSFAVLGGHDLVISRSARNPAAALRLIDFLTRPPEVYKDEEDGAQIPVLIDAADDIGLDKSGSLIDATKRTRLVLRPPIARYAAVSQVISSCVKAVINGVDPTGMPADIERRVQDVLDGHALRLCASP